MKTKIFLNAKALLPIAAVTIIFFSFVLLQNGNTEISTFEGNLKAVIIDQLYDDIPNENFLQKATEYFEAAGYVVDIFTTKQITVDFYKRLPEMNYNFILVRTHGLNDDTDDNVSIFTGEKYQTDQYIQEQLFGQIKKGAPLLDLSFQPSQNESSEWVAVNDTYHFLTTPVKIERSETDTYFLITPKLIDELMVGKFPESVIMIGGCKTMANTSLADSLIKRGASLVIGWDEDVGAADNDKILLKVLSETLTNNVEIHDAIDSVMKKNPLRTGGTLHYYSG